MLDVLKMKIKQYLLMIKKLKTDGKKSFLMNYLMNILQII